MLIISLMFTKYAFKSWECIHWDSEIWEYNKELLNSVTVHGPYRMGDSYITLPSGVLY